MPEIRLGDTFDNALLGVIAPAPLGTKLRTAGENPFGTP